MPLITRDFLYRYAEQKRKETGLRAETILHNDSIAEFSEYRNYDIFLCHSSLDSKMILGLREYFKALGFSTYIDWFDDPQLDRTKVNKHTANVLRSRMKYCKCLFFASSDNSSGSKWMPWELGYFDGIKGKVAICPITESAIQAQSDSYNTNGQEYLGLYSYVARREIQGTNQDNLWIHDSLSKYTKLQDWINE